MAESIAPQDAMWSLFSTPLPFGGCGNIMVPQEICRRAGIQEGCRVCARVIGPGRILLVAFPPDQADAALRDASQMIEEGMEELARRVRELD